jgi:hypothetical protein
MMHLRNRYASWATVLAVVAVIGSALALIPIRAKAASTEPNIVVSLTWDDGRASQFGSLAIQEAHGIKATYYINSGNIDSSPYYLTKPQLDSIALSGNEIGGHTARHENLTTIPLDAATAAVCGDRETLVGWYGPDAGKSFAYPYGANNAEVKKIPGSCGYTSARGVTGVRTPNACLGCRLAESLPPADPWYLAGPTSITSTTTLDDLKFQVNQAATNGGGWVLYSLHSLGDSTDKYSITPAIYDQFLGWLQSRSDVSVRTVGDVMGTAWPTPSTTTTSLTPPPPAVAVPLVNADFEIDANRNGVSDCWLRGYAGTNSATWKRSTDAHSGTAAEEVTISAFTSGDRKVVQLLDNGTANGGCAPSVSDASTYSLSLWYRSTGKNNMVVFTRDAVGAWKYWKTGPAVAPSATWTSTTFAPGKLPVGTTALSYGLALASVGTLATDDYWMTQDQAVAPPATDQAIKNSSFEADSNNDGIADCWMRGGYGIASYSFQRVADAHSGTWGQKLSLTSLTTGDRKILQPLDSGQAAGGCALNVSGGQQLRLGTWYHADTTPQLFVYLRDASGTWRWWITTVPFAATAGWNQATFITPVLPAGTTALSFGLGLTNIGTLVVDDASASLL